MSDDTAPTEVAAEVMAERAEARPRWADVVGSDSDTEADEPEPAGMIEVRDIEAKEDVITVLT